MGEGGGSTAVYEGFFEGIGCRKFFRRGAPVAYEPSSRDSSYIIS